jgi:hypothetical protein
LDVRKLVLTRYQQKNCLRSKLLLILGDVTLSLMNGACQRRGNMREKRNEEKVVDNYPRLATKHTNEMRERERSTGFHRQNNPRSDLLLITGLMRRASR